jgi:hypothetical protein
MVKHTWSFSWIEWFSLVMGICALAAYLHYKGTEDPTLLILATLADVLGYWPTIKKGWAAPETVLLQMELELIW